jgi:hypothetical protein
VQWPKWFPLHDPAFRWGLLNPFGPPPPWWSPQRRKAYFDEHGAPWAEAATGLGSVKPCRCGRMIVYYVSRDFEYEDWRHANDKTLACGE